jgi:hypothetical protein
MALLALASPVSAQLVRSAAGLDSASITGVRDAFRVDLGGGTVAGANGSFGGVRREINWDGVPAASAAPNNLAANFFNTTSPRGVVFSTPGTGFQVSGATTDLGAGQPAAANFGNINPSYSSTFSAFSAQRLFTPLGSNITDVTFFVPGTNTPALTNGFGSVFSDVDLANVTSLLFFDANNNALGGPFFVPNFAGSPTFSFLGVSFASPLVSRVRITTGNSLLGVNESLPTVDLVVMDDFIYGEPTAAAASTPDAGSSVLFLGLSLGMLLLARRSLGSRRH